MPFFYTLKGLSNKQQLFFTSYYFGHFKLLVTFSDTEQRLFLASSENFEGVDLSLTQIQHMRTRDFSVFKEMVEFLHVYSEWTNQIEDFKIRCKVTLSQNGQQFFPFTGLH